MSAQPSPDRLRVVTVNIWNRQGPWERRLPLLVEGLRALDPDVVGLQEVLGLDGAGDQAGELAGPLGLHHAYGPAWEIGGGLRFGNAVLSRWPIAASQHMEVPGDGESESRGLLHCKIAAPFGELPVFVTHLTWQLDRTASRCRQVAFIVEQLRALAPRATDRFPAVLLGDFNAEPQSDEIRFLGGYHALEGRTARLADCFAVAGDGSPGFTFCRRNPYAAQVREPDRRIDYVFVDGPDPIGRGEPLSCRVVLDAPGPDGAWPTDHFGVAAELAVTPVPLPAIG